MVLRYHLEHHFRYSASGIHHSRSMETAHGQGLAGSGSEPLRVAINVSWSYPRNLDEAS
jgi:hypothetical protein